MLRTLPALTACIAVIACGIVHGFFTDRWQKPVALDEAAGRLEQVPDEIGGWVAERLEVNPRDTAELEGCIQRRYKKRGATGPYVNVALVCGRPGPVSIHTPAVCYAASGYDVGSPRRVKAQDGKSEFWTADAVKKKATEETRLRIYWAWSDGQGWTAPDDPRMLFTGHCQVLHKLYVLRELGGASDSSADDPCLEFMSVLLPAVDRALFKPGS
jgi:hypothetical protein